MRMLMKAPSFSVVATIALALGIGANTAIFSVVNAVLLKPLPFVNAEQLMMVWETDSSRGQVRGSASYPNFADWREQNHVFERMATFHTSDFIMTGRGESTRLQGALVNADLFPLLGVTPMLGRGFLPNEDKPGDSGRVVLLGQELFQKRFGSDTNAVGQPLVLDGKTYMPLRHLSGNQGPLEIYNSPLSEIACLGFEYGYSAATPSALVLWEAQFGDFANAAQVIIDSFIVSGEAKWGQTSRLTLLLPHGYEGSGPEHSSARLERFLALAAEGNIRVASPTTPAQYFHLLRRQARIAKQRPLIVMTPKSLLRLPQATNTIADMAEGTRFQPVLAEPGVDDEQVTRLLLCTGKIYYDLVGHPDRASHPGLAVARVELLYPFPEGQILELMRRYPNLREVVWVQEEPRNVGARAHMFPRLMQIMPHDIHFGFIGRPERASPGEGYPAAHIAEQNRIVTAAIDLDRPISQYPRKAPGQR